MVLHQYVPRKPNRTNFEPTAARYAVTCNLADFGTAEIESYALDLINVRVADQKVR
jgi:hypothetical protein